LDGVNGAPWTATEALAEATRNFLLSGFFQNSGNAFVLNYTLQPFTTWLHTSMFASSAAANATELLDATTFMLPTYGMTASSTDPFATGAGIALYSVFSQAALRPPPGEVASDPAPWRNSQLQLNLASLNYQLWETWSLTANGLTQANAAATLRVPVLVSPPGILQAPVGQSFSYQVGRQNPTAPMNVAPNIYFTATGLPPGLTIDSFGNITGTPAPLIPGHSGNYTATVTAMNPAGTSSPLSLQIKVVPTQAQAWMTYNYNSSASLESIRSTDTDGDGYNAETEYAFGTDPNSPNSAVAGSSRLSDSVLRLQWNGLTNQTYRVQTSTNLHGVWSVRLGVPIVTNGAVFGTNGIFYQPMRADVTNGGTPQEFFRIGTEFTPSQLE
jgi:hypothetical protein